jgi:hypothetical protein
MENNKDLAGLIKQIGIISPTYVNGKVKFYLRFRSENVRKIDYLMLICPNGSRSVQEKDGKIWYWANYSTQKALSIFKKTKGMLDEMDAIVVLVEELQDRKTFQRTGKRLDKVEMKIRKDLVSKISQAMRDYKKNL